MRISGVATALRSRARHPGRTGLLLLVAGLWAPLRLAIDMPYGRFGSMEAFLPLGLLLVGLLLAPMAWQWSGTDAPMASMSRGLPQSLLWNALWLAGMIVSFSALADLEKPAPRPPRPGEMAPRAVPPRWREHASQWAEGDSRPEGREPDPNPPLSPELQIFSMGLLLSTVLGRVLAEREAVEAREAALHGETERARALALQAQMQPHALFNALSGLVELAQEDPEATERALIALCDYLRRLMDHARAETAPLRQERALLEDYLRIEQLRLGDALAVTWAWPEWADDLVLPPLLLQPLVENAVIHGIAARSEGGTLRIAVSREPEGLCLQVENSAPSASGEAAPRREGLGLGHLRQRLSLWGGPRAAFGLQHEGEWVRATIRIPGDLIR